MKKKMLLVISLISLFVMRNLFAGYGTHSMLSLRLPTSAAIAGFNNAYTAVAEDVNSISANPAGLGFVKNNQFLFMYNNYVQDVNHNYLAYCQPVEAIGGKIGINVSLFDAGDFDRTTIGTTGILYNSNGFFTSKDMIIGASYGKAMNPNLNFGLSIKYINSKIDNYKADGYAGDLGIIYSEENMFSQPVKIGFVIKNLGTKIKYDKEKESLPTEYRIGFASFFNLSKDVNLLPAIDLSYIKDEKVNVNVGAEISYLNSFFVRCGYDNSIDIGNKLSFGAGYKIKNISIDYAFTSYDELGDGHRISLTIK